MGDQKKKMFSGAESLLFKRASELRAQQTFAEELLWNYLKTKPLGYKFRRQHPFSNYILDFYCHQLKLVVEVDGSIHNTEETKRNDAIREQQLRESGLTIVRFTNEQVRLEIEKVILSIEELLEQKQSPKTNKDLPI